MKNEVIHIEALVHAPAPMVWQEYNDPEAIKQWNQASPDWHCPASENDLRVGGRFKSTMAAKDGSFAFDFGGVYTAVDEPRAISYTMDDGRTVDIRFYDLGSDTRVDIDFVAENSHPADMQQAGWQAILDSFKRYTEHKHTASND